MWHVHLSKPVLCFKDHKQSASHNAIEHHFSFPGANIRQTSAKEGSFARGWRLRLRLFSPTRRGFKEIALIYSVPSKLSAGKGNLTAFERMCPHVDSNASCAINGPAMHNGCVPTHAPMQRNLVLQIWTASEHQCSHNKRGINVRLISGEMGSAVSCT